MTGSSLSVDDTPEDGEGLHQLLLCDDEGRGQPDDVIMGGLGQQSTVSQLLTHIPCIET